MVSPPTESVSLHEEKGFTTPPTRQGFHAAPDLSIHAREAGMWLRALRSFFNLYNHPTLEAELSDLIAHDWTHELRIALASLLRASQLVLQSARFEQQDDTIFDEADNASAITSLSLAGATKAGAKDDSLLALAA